MVDSDFNGLLARARAGDQAAVGQLLALFEDDVRRMVRVRLPRTLRGQFDSMDFVQAVWASVLVGDQVDPSHFVDARHFRGFLAGVARNKVFQEHRRRTRTRKYDLGREQPLYVRRAGRDRPIDLAAPDPSPSAQAQADECLQGLVAGRQPHEAEVVELRRQGMTFEEIAVRTGQDERSARRIIAALRRRREGRA